MRRNATYSAVRSKRYARVPPTRAPSPTTTNCCCRRAVQAVVEGDDCYCRLRAEEAAGRRIAGDGARGGAHPLPSSGPPARAREARSRRRAVDCSIRGRQRRGRRRRRGRGTRRHRHGSSHSICGKERGRGVEDEGLGGGGSGEPGRRRAATAGRTRRALPPPGLPNRGRE
jgi:hypothetical protein